MGGDWLVSALAAWSGWRVFELGKQQLTHVEWHGFHFYDLVFPLFLFIAGVAIPLSFERRIARGERPERLALQVAQRALILVALGVLYNTLGRIDFKHGPSWSDFDNPRYASVLARIGLGYAGAALLVLGFSLRAQIAWSVGLLLGYWAALTWIPVPGYGAGNLEPGATLTDYIDRQFLPGQLYQTVRDPEGLLSTVPAISTALFGVFAGRWLSWAQTTPSQKLRGLCGAGVLALAVGSLWHLVFPINKNLWSSSFVLWCAGWSLLLLAGFYWLVDLRGERRLSGFLAVIGKNPIFIYMLSPLLPGLVIAQALFGADVGGGTMVLFIVLFVASKWGLLWVMDRRGWYLRV